MTDTARTRCLILACGNSLRGDDGVGPWLANWAEKQFHELPDVRVIARQQWTPDLAEDIALAECVLFIDAAAGGTAGELSLSEVAVRVDRDGLATHHVDAANLLTLCKELYDVTPRTSLLLTIGARSTDLGESFSDSVQTSLPTACAAIEKFVSDAK